MDFHNREMKIDQIIGYFNEKKINLIPPFQRGSVWKLPARKKLLQNIVNKRPIPAIFLYKQPAGSQFDYNILDGKQRLESLILFVGNQRNDMKVKNVEHYFYGTPPRDESNFAIQIDGREQAFRELDDDLVRRFKDYAISTIEINLDDDDASIDEIIRLFIDINQEGVRVTRFDSVKAFGKDPLFKQAFGLVGLHGKKKRSSYLKMKTGSFSFVLSKLNIISRVSDENSKVNRMWERITEIALFSRPPHQHRAPADILKGFINPAGVRNKKLNEEELTKLRTAFGFLESTYRKYPRLTTTKLATDQPQFYTLITTLLSTDLLTRYKHPELAKRIVAFAGMVDDSSTTPRNLKRTVDSYKVAATKQTTNPNRRAERHSALLKALKEVEV